MKLLKSLESRVSWCLQGKLHYYYSYLGDANTQNPLVTAFATTNKKKKKKLQIKSNQKKKKNSNPKKKEKKNYKKNN